MSGRQLVRNRGRVMTKAFGIAKASRLRSFTLAAVGIAPASLSTYGGAAFAQVTSPDNSPAALVVVPMEPGPSASSPATPAELPKFLDDRRLQVMEGQARPLFEAIEQRRAEKLKRKAIEADLKRNAEEVRRAVDSMTQSGGTAATPAGTIVDIIRPAQAIAAPAPPQGSSAEGPPPPSPLRATAGIALPFLAAPAAVPSPPPGSAACPLGTATTSPLPGGRIRIEVAEPCRKGEPVTIRYAPYLFIRPLDDSGRLNFVLDLFQGVDVPLSLQFKNGDSRPLAIGATDIDRVSKVAVIWGKPVNLDLHVHEYAAAPGAAGHIWSRAPSSAEAARDESARTQRGRGFLSFASNGTEPGHQVEVYTLWHHPEQAGGVVSTSLDYETRGATGAGETCGEGALAQIPFETVALTPRQPVVRERGLIGAARCGDSLIEKARYLDEAISDLSLAIE